MTLSKYGDIFLAAPTMPIADTRILTSVASFSTLIESDRNFISHKSSRSDNQQEKISLQF